MKSSRILGLLGNRPPEHRSHHVYRQQVLDSKIDEEVAMDATERCLERLCEAVHRLTRGDVDLEALEPGVEWSEIRGFGNRLRHEYDRLDSEVMQRVLDQLPLLHEAALRLQTRFDPDQPNTRPMA